MIRLAMKIPPMTAEEVGRVMRSLRHRCRVIEELKALGDGRSID